MHEGWQDLLPFYAVGTLPAADRAAVEAHLAGCAACQQTIDEWRVVATAVQAEASARAAALPPLSPVVRANLRRRPTPAQALHSAANLVWAQRAVVARRGLALAALLVLVVGVLLSAGLRSNAPAALPLLTLVPVAAALGAAFLHGPDTDPAFEIVATTPTPPATLTFARLTLVLGFVGSVSGLGSLVLSAVDGAALGPLVGAWLGPMLFLSALATVLSLLWQPVVAAGTTLALWAGVVVLLNAELGGRPPLNLSLRPLLHPSWLLFGLQLAVAGLLWLLVWLLLTREATSWRTLESGG